MNITLIHNKKEHNFDLPLETTLYYVQKLFSKIFKCESVDILYKGNKIIINDDNKTTLLKDIVTEVDSTIRLKVILNSENNSIKNQTPSESNSQVGINDINENNNKVILAKSDNNKLFESLYNKKIKQVNSALKEFNLKIFEINNFLFKHKGGTRNDNLTTFEKKIYEFIDNLIIYIKKLMSILDINNFVTYNEMIHNLNLFYPELNIFNRNNSVVDDINLSSFREIKKYHKNNYLLSPISKFPMNIKRNDNNYTLNSDRFNYFNKSNKKSSLKKLLLLDNNSNHIPKLKALKIKINDNKKEKDKNINNNDENINNENINEENKYDENINEENINDENINEENINEENKYEENKYEESKYDENKYDENINEENTNRENKSDDIFDFSSEENKEEKNKDNKKDNNQNENDISNICKRTINNISEITSKSGKSNESNKNIMNEEEIKNLDINITPKSSNKSNNINLNEDKSKKYKLKKDSDDNKNNESNGNNKINKNTNNNLKKEIKAFKNRKISFSPSFIPKQKKINKENNEKNFNSTIHENENENLTDSSYEPIKSFIEKTKYEVKFEDNDEDKEEEKIDEEEEEEETKSNIKKEEKTSSTIKKDEKTNSTNKKEENSSSIIKKDSTIKKEKEEDEKKPSHNSFEKISKLVQDLTPSKAEKNKKYFNKMENEASNNDNIEVNSPIYQIPNSNSRDMVRAMSRKFTRKKKTKMTNKYDFLI